jgi:hypothetical protein
MVSIIHIYVALELTILFVEVNSFITLFLFIELADKHAARVEKEAAWP